MTDSGLLDLDTTFLRLRGDGSMEPLPVGTDFWPRLMAGQLGDFHHEYLVTTARYDADWPGWEQHPLGEEVVILLSGAVTFVLEQDGGTREVELGAQGAFVLVPRGTWHTAKVKSPSQLLFITAGEGTRGRPA
jgi:mannose-6-phosphate isomerase-like protein (cupin superfamily)